MRFILYLTNKTRPANPDTASGHWSTVAGILGREHGVKVAQDICMVRLKAFIKGTWREKGGRKPATKRHAMSPHKLRRAMNLCLDINDKDSVNLRALLTCGIQFLARGSELGRGDKKTWKAASGITRDDLKLSKNKQSLHIMLAAAKGKSLGGKDCPVTVGGGGRLIDAVAEVINLEKVDPLEGEERKTTPAFRNEKGVAFSVNEISRWIKKLMKAIGESVVGYSSHSLRIGGATALYTAGVDPLVIMMMGRWSSDCYQRYIRGDVNLAMRVSSTIGSTKLSPEDEVFRRLEEFDIGSDYEN